MREESGLGLEHLQHGRNENLRSTKCRNHRSWLTEHYSLLRRKVGELCGNCDDDKVRECETRPDTHFAIRCCCCPPDSHGGEDNSAPRPSCELGPQILSPRCRSAPNGHESGVQLRLSAAPYMREESVVVGQQDMFLGEIYFGLFRITIANPRGTIA